MHVEMVKCQALQSGRPNHNLSLVNIGALQSHYDWCDQIELSSSCNDTLSNNITSHDATKYVHQQGIHLRIPCDDFESFFYLVCGGSTTNIKEISRAATMQFDDVHGSHGQTCSINHAPYVTIQSDIVQVVVGSLHFPLVLL